MSDETAGSCRLSPAVEVAPLDSEDILGEILLRLPLQPSSLPRVSAVSKLWRSLATSAAFHRRFRFHHRKLKPPILGVFLKAPGCMIFTSVLGPPDRIPAERFSLRICGDDSWSLLGCRHGRVLVFNRTRLQVLVFHPVSDDLHILDVPPEFGRYESNVHGAVLCAAGDEPGQVHGGCQSSPFQVVLVGTLCGNQWPIIDCVYSSDTGMWGDLVSTPEPCGGFYDHRPCTLTGNSLYWWLYGPNIGILEFNLDRQRLAVIKGLPIAETIDHRGKMQIIRAEDGDVGIVNETIVKSGKFG